MSELSVSGIARNSLKRASSKAPVKDAPVNHGARRENSIPRKTYSAAAESPENARNDEGTEKPGAHRSKVEPRYFNAQV